MHVVTDQAAFSHLFMSVMSQPTALGPESPGAAARRQEAYIEHIGLNPEQGSVLTEIAARYRDYLNALSARATDIAGPAESRSSLSNEQKARLSALSRDKGSVLVGLIRELEARLDDQGDRILHEYIEERVKPNVQFR